MNSLRRLDPFIDINGLLRAGGKIRHNEKSYDEKHPLILPKKGQVIDLIMHHLDKSCHQGHGITHARIRSVGVWIINGSSALAHHITKCVTYQPYWGTSVTQKMADLPEDRLKETAPFTYCDVDYFGPFHIKEIRCELKQ